MKETKKKKLLVFHPIIAPYRIDFINELSKHYDARVVLYWRNLKNQTFDYAKIEAQFVFNPEFCVKEELGTFGWLKRLWFYLCQEKPDLVFVSEYGIISLLVLVHRFLTRFKYKIVCITDDSYDMLADNNHFSKRHKFAINLLAPLINEFINVEPNSAQWYQSHFGKGIYFPIIVDEKKTECKYEKILPISETFVKKYGLEGKKVLLFVGRLVALKNVGRIIDAVKQISNTDLRFVIVGSGDEEKSLKEKSGSDNRIIFVGRKEGDALYAWYNIANAFILASYQEPFGAVTNEALLGGCRCLISKKAGSHCLIEPGINGETFDPYNLYEIKEIIEHEMSSSNPLKLPLIKRKSLMTFQFGVMFNSVITRLEDDNA